MLQQIKRPFLTITREGQPQRKAVIFVHGILSNHHPFASMQNCFETDTEFDRWGIGYFDYDFWQAMEDSASQLSQHLIKQFTGRGQEVTLVCHSMGGLVGRFAILAAGQNMPFLKRLVMLGTPNFGAIRPAQLGLLGQMTLRATGKLWGVFTRKTGVIDLTKVQEKYLELTRKHGRPANALNIEYITIPGLYFNNDRSAGEMTGNFTSRALAVMNLGAEWLVLTYPSAAMKIERPHDGIVEESSVSFFNGKPGDFSEKGPCIRGNRRGSPPPTCSHIIHKECRDITHVMLHQDDTIIQMVKGILLAGNALLWHKKLNDTEVYECDINPSVG